MYGYDGYGMNGWMWLWGAVLISGMLVLIGGLVWAIVATTAHRRTAPYPTNPNPIDPNPIDPDAAGPASARQILDQRYARGELDTDEYRQRLETLGS